MSIRSAGVRSAYADAGVDVAAGDRAIELLRSRIGVSDGDVLGGIGGFGAVLELPSGYRHPLLVTATDGVGTKTEIARRLRRFDTIGRDLVAMCADDIVCHGARPAFFLDYLAVGRVEPERVATLVGGIADACAELGCALVGGETAEHPGLMAEDAFDLAGFCIGFVERDELVDGSTARVGDVVIGMASSGLHANGFSLVSRLVDDGRLPLTDELLVPTRLYARTVLGLLDSFRARELRIGGLAHVTGGGLPGNLPRAVPAHLGIRVARGAWDMPELFSRVGAAAGMDDEELRSTFNCGIGMAAIVDPEAARAAVDILADSGVEAWPIGEVVPGADLGNVRYVEA